MLICPGLSRELTVSLPSESNHFAWAGYITSNEFNTSSVDGKINLMRTLAALTDSFRAFTEIVPHLGCNCFFPASFKSSLFHLFYAVCILK
jgi:hypothetical protein